MLNHKQQLFVLEYQKCLNATKAAKAAGYSPKTAYSIGQRLLKNVEIQQALQQAMNERKSKLIAKRQERQEFWTFVMRDKNTDMKHRLKASELLAKSECDFIERQEVKNEIITCEYDLTKLNEQELLTLREILLHCSWTN